VVIAGALADPDGSELLSFMIGGLPAGAILSAGLNNGDGTWTLLPRELPGLTLTPPRDFSGTIDATVTAVAIERSTGGVATTTAVLPISVAGVADGVIVDAAPIAAGREDGAIAVPLAATLRDIDGSEAVSVIATGVPAGASFSAGTRGPDGVWYFAGADLPGLMFTPPPHAAGSFAISFAVASTEADGAGSGTATAEIVFTVTPVADAPLLAASAASGTEDAPVPLAISAGVADADGSEELVRVVIAGLPAGARLSAGMAQPDGSWVLAPGELTGLALVPAEHWSGDASLTVTAVARETATGEEASATTALAVTVAPVADAPLLGASLASGSEGAPIPLAITAALADRDGSETLGPVVVSGLPDGFSLSAGVNVGGGAWEVPAASLAGLALVPPPRWHGTLSLALGTTATEGDGGAAAATTTLDVTIAPVAHDPTLTLDTAAPVVAGVSEATLLDSAVLTDPDGDLITRATVTLGAGRQAGDSVSVTGHALAEEGGDLVIGDTGLRIVGGGFDAATGTLTLAGAAPADTYASVMAGLMLVGPDGGVLEAGDRTVTIALTDAVGDATSETLTVSVLPSVLEGDGSGGVLEGTGAADRFIGSDAGETMRGGAGDDLFLLDAGGGVDTVEGGSGFDTIMLGGVAGPPAAGAPAGDAWTVVLDNPATQGEIREGALDFSEPASGRIVFGDGTQVDFANIERITW
jgi:hypothetical protein